MRVVDLSDIASSSSASKSKRRRKPADPARTWARSLDRRRPGLVPFVLTELAALYGTPRRDTRLDPVSELVLTILSQNTADVNSERAFEALRSAYPADGPVTVHRVTAPDGTEAPPEGWGGRGLDAGAAPGWDALEHAPLDELMEVIRPGGLAAQKAPRIQAALRHLRDATGGYDLGLLAAMEPRAARDWLTQVPGIGKKTASIVLLFCFGQPLMPVDTHVERVSRRIGLVPPKAGPDEQHEVYWHLLAPEDVRPAHVLLIRHGRKTCDARRPACDRCPLAPRCRYLDPRAP
ncbi:MAG: endonuclease III [Chloroflexota bacterium]